MKLWWHTFRKDKKFSIMNKNDKYFYKNLEFDAAVFKAHNQIFLSAKDYKFYSNLILSLKTIPNNPKKYKRYSLLAPSDSLKKNISRKVTSFDFICFVYEKLENYQDDGAVSIIENGKEIILKYTCNFIYAVEENIEDLEWNSPYGEIDVEGIVFCPNWWKK